MRKLSLGLVVFPAMMSGLSIAHAYGGYGNAAGLKGQYWVPVSEELKAYGTYPIADVCWYGEGTKRGIGYRLPEELTGEPDSDIRLTGEDRGEATFRMQGEHGKAECQRIVERGKVQCTIHYTGLQMSEAGVNDVLTHEYSSDPAQLGLRLKVSAVFLSDPVGVLEFPDELRPFPANP